MCYLLIRPLMKTVLFFLNTLSNFWVRLKNIFKLSPSKAKINNVGPFKLKLFNSKVSKYKFILYFYILITMALCPYLDNLFNEWYDNEPYNMYYMVGSLIVLNIFINKFMTIPTKSVLD